MARLPLMGRPSVSMGANTAGPFANGPTIEVGLENRAVKPTDQEVQDEADRNKICREARKFVRSPARERPITARTTRPQRTPQSMM